MSLDNLNCLQQELYSEAEVSAERKKQEVDYVLRICKENYDKLIEVFGNEIKNSENPERVLYDKTLETINGFEKDFCQVVGISMFYENLGKLKLSAYLLGWVAPKNISQIAEKKHSYLLSPSEKGLEILDGLRKIHGLKPIREARKASAEFIRRGIGQFGQSANALR